VAEPFSVPPVSTFVVRVWREWSAGAVRWRGQIEHVQSGEGAAFLDADGMFRFMRQFGIAVGAELVDDRGDHSPEESRRVLR
jgi:hypothetical protein